MQPNMYGVKDMRIVRFIIQETGTYNTQYRRPYQTHLNKDGMNAILETVDRAKSITPTALAGVAGQFITPSATPESTIQIANGWTTRRLRFFMEIETKDRTGMMTLNEFVVGYTDHVGLSLSNFIDPNMTFFINGVNTTRTQTYNTALGSQTHYNLVDASHILVNDQYSGMLGANQVYGLRPEDVYDQIDNSDLKTHLVDGFVMDGRGKLTTNATKSKRSNSVVPVYMSSVLDSYLQTARSQRNEQQSAIIQTARATVESDAISSDPFMSWVRKMNNQSGSNSFTYGDLQRLDPNVVNVTAIAPVNEASRGTLHSVGQTADWGSSNGSTLFATTLAQAVPGYMMQYGISKVQLRSTNLSIDGSIATQIGFVKTFATGVDVSREVQAFIFRLEKELLKNLSFNNQMSFSLDMTCDLLGETWINLSLNGEPSVPYVTPSFCDALMAPIVTSHVEILDGVASDFDSLMTNIFENDSGYGASGAMKTGLI